jgi:hypothetical protein
MLIATEARVKMKARVNFMVKCELLMFFFRVAAGLGFFVHLFILFLEGTGYIKAGGVGDAGVVWFPRL